MAPPTDLIAEMEAAEAERNKRPGARLRRFFRAAAPFVGGALLLGLGIVLLRFGWDLQDAEALQGVEAGAISRWFLFFGFPAVAAGFGILATSLGFPKLARGLSLDAEFGDTSFGDAHGFDSHDGCDGDG